MATPTPITFRPARAGDGQATFDITWRSVAGLAVGHYSNAQIAGWMGARTPEFYEGLIARGRMVVAERDGSVVAFVDAEPGEVTRLFVLPEAAGGGLGKRLLAIGIETARRGHAGAVRLEATINAAEFYRRNGFREIGRGHFSHGLGGDPIEIIHMELTDPADVPREAGSAAGSAPPAGPAFASAGPGAGGPDSRAGP